MVAVPGALAVTRPRTMVAVLSFDVAQATASVRSVSRRGSARSSAMCPIARQFSASSCGSHDTLSVAMLATLPFAGTPALHALSAAAAASVNPGRWRLALGGIALHLDPIDIWPNECVD